MVLAVLIRGARCERNPRHDRPFLFGPPER
jgi:hypothetical protein